MIYYLEINGGIEIIVGRGNQRYLVNIRVSGRINNN